MIWQVRSTGSADTERLGELLGGHLRGGQLLELQADLGGGKTTLVRGLARGAGSQNNVSSPTFTINKVYKAKDFEIHHFDFYRLNEPGVIADQLGESLNDPQVLTVVEWSDIVKDVLPEERITIELKPVASDPDEREITFKYPPAATELIKRLETAWVEVEP